MAHVPAIFYFAVFACAIRAFPIHFGSEQAVRVSGEESSSSQREDRKYSTDLEWLVTSKNEDDSEERIEFLHSFSSLDNDTRLIWLPHSGSQTDDQGENRYPFKRRIYGRDDRKCHGFPDKLPYSAIGYFVDNRCTGFLVAPNVVMTSASCLYDRQAKKIYDANFDFYRGRSRYRVEQKMSWKSVIVPYSFINRPWAENDYGFVLFSNTTLSSEYLGLMVNNFTKDLPISIVSYFSAKDDCMCTVNCTASLYQHSWYEEHEQNSKLFCYHCDTNDRSGGSPLLYNDYVQLDDGTVVEPGRFVVGVNVGYFAQGYRGGCNVGSRLTKTRLEVVEEVKSLIN